MQIDAGDKQAGQAYVTKAWRLAEADWQPDGIGTQLWVAFTNRLGAFG